MKFEDHEYIDIVETQFGKFYCGAILEANHFFSAPFKMRVMLNSSKRTWPIIFFFTKKKKKRICNLGDYKIISQKYCGVNAKAEKPNVRYLVTPLFS